MCEDVQIDVVIVVIVEVRFDILLLIGIDWDYDGLVFVVLWRWLQVVGVDYLYSFVVCLNVGMFVWLDLDQDGWLGGLGDKQGFGFFIG